MQNKPSLQKAVELLEMIEFILLSGRNVVNSGNGKSVHSSEVTGKLPLGGVTHTLSQSIGILRGLMDDIPEGKTDRVPVEGSHSDNENITENIMISDSAQKELSEHTEADRRKKGMVSGETPARGLASRIRPVPEEVRGRVRELVDMIENDEFAR
jgi:hypothetical protein